MMMDDFWFYDEDGTIQTDDEDDLRDDDGA